MGLTTILSLFFLISGLLLWSSRFRISGSQHRVRQRTKRVSLVIAATMLVCFGLVGLSWDRILSFPAFRDHPRYAALPEPVLLRLLADGDERALEELHGRLIPGRVTDAALSSLVDRALDRFATNPDETENRWGDFILYAFLMGKISQDQVAQFGDLYTLAETEVQDSIPPDADRMWVQLSCWGREGIGGSFGFYADWVRGHKQIKGGFGSEHSPLVFEMSYHRISVNHDSDHQIFHTNRNEGWMPFNSAGGAWRLGQDLPEDARAFTVSAKRSFKISHGKRVLGGWSITQNRSCQRAPYLVEIIESVDDLSSITVQSQLIAVDRVTVPGDIENAKLHERTSDYRKPLFVMRFSEGFDTGVLGECFIRVDMKELHINSVAYARYESSGSDQAIAIRPARKGLSFFEEQAAFWECASKKGCVDILIRPTGERWEEHPSMRSYLDGVIVFRDVPVETLMPVKRKRAPDGSEREVWYWSPGPDFIEYQWLHGETQL